MSVQEREAFNLNWKAARNQCLGWFAWNVDKHHQPPWIQMRHLSYWMAAQGLQRKGSKICPETGVQWPHLLLFHFSGCARLCCPIKKPQDCPWLVISNSRGYWSLPVCYPCIQDLMRMVEMVGKSGQQWRTSPRGGKRVLTRQSQVWLHHLYLLQPLQHHLHKNRLAQW